MDELEKLKQIFIRLKALMVTGSSITYARVRLNGAEPLAVVDSGSSVTILDYDLAQRSGVNKRNQQSALALGTAGSYALTISGTADITFTYPDAGERTKDTTTAVEAIVIRNLGCDMIIGNDVARRDRYTICHDTETLSSGVGGWRVPLIYREQVSANAVVLMPDATLETTDGGDIEAVHNTVFEVTLGGDKSEPASLTVAVDMSAETERGQQQSGATVPENANNSEQQCGPDNNLRAHTEADADNQELTTVETLGKDDASEASLTELDYNRYPFTGRLPPDAPTPSNPPFTPSEHSEDDVDGERKESSEMDDDMPDLTEDSDEEMDDDMPNLTEDSDDEPEAKVSKKVADQLFVQVRSRVPTRSIAKKITGVLIARHSQGALEELLKAEGKPELLRTIAVEGRRLRDAGHISTRPPQHCEVAREPRHTDILPEVPLTLHNVLRDGDRQIFQRVKGIVGGALIASNLDPVRTKESALKAMEFCFDPFVA